MVEVSQALIRGRGIQELAIAREITRREQVRQRARQTQIKRQQEAIEVQRRTEEVARRKFEAGPKFRIVGIEEGVKSTIFTAKTREFAEIQKAKARKAFGKDISIGIEEIKFGEVGFRTIRVAPPPSERGRDIQRARLKLERELSIKQAGQERFVKEIQEKVFKGKFITPTERRTFELLTIPIPTTQLEFIKSLESRQRALETLKKQERLKIGIVKNGIRPSRLDIVRISNGVLPSKLDIFKKKIETQAERQRIFLAGKGFERIERVAGVLTGGEVFERVREPPGAALLGPSLLVSRGVKEKEERGFIGRRIQTLVSGIAAGPIGFGGIVVGAGIEKIKLAKEALEAGKIEVPGGFVEFKKEDVLEEFTRGAPKRVKEEFNKLSGEEKLDIALFTLVAPFLGGGPIRRFLGKRVTRGKAIEQLSASEKAKLERFELSVEELKGVKTKPSKINLAEAERLSSTAAKALDRVIIRNKDNLVVGGSVAQRTQIIGKSRIPADVDLFTTRRPAGLIREIATELREAGIERVSEVRGKQITIEGKKAIEVKELSLLEANIKKVQLPLQSVRSAFVRTSRGVRVLRLGAQAQRKVIGGFGLELGRRRLKDIGDLPSILRTLRRLRTEKRGSVLLRRRRILEEPSFFPISLKGEPPSTLIGRLGKPSGLRGVLPSIPIIPSILKPSPREEPSILRPPPREIPSVLRPIPREEPSILRPPPKEVPSIIAPPIKEVPSVLKPITEEPPPAAPKIDLDRKFVLAKKQILITQKAPSYNVQIRKGEKRGDKFVIAEKRLPQNKALKLMRRILDNRIEASGRLKPNRKIPKVADDFFAPDMSKFRPPRPGSKLPSNTIIEKKQHRLDTLGELQQISFFRKRKELKQRIARLRGLVPNNPGKSNNPGLEPDIPFKTDIFLKLPKTTRIQKKILELVKREGAAVTGSFAQKTFIKKSRGFKDIDIVTKDVSAFTRKLKKELKSKIRIKKVLIKSRQGRFKIARIISRRTGKVIADIDPLKFAEGGLVSKFGTQKVEGLKIISVRARLQAKIMQRQEGKKRRKIATDIRQLTASRLRTPTGFFSKGGIL